ncbi:hypothetical protein RF11_11031 [Thelohanellus kitauei]|uniref:Uncharacterized protein n=1 Tax=Thelohanellus kitauei TaxID=669202 RepID=A0A0C2IIQ8_THEKT|nr:hypothetical protein RF11_11031 [Thelohanellus kitauei]
MHPFLIDKIYSIKSDSQESNTLQPDIIQLIQFYAIPFLRLKVIGDNINYIMSLYQVYTSLNQPKNQEHVRLSIVYAEFHLLMCGCEAVRSFYEKHSKILKYLESVIQYKNSIQDMAESILYHFEVYPFDISTQDDPQTYTLLLTSEMMIYVTETTSDEDSCAIKVLMI